MVQINLRDYYPDVYSLDLFIDVQSDLIQQFLQWNRDEKAYERRRYRYNAHFSLDRNDGTQNDIISASLTPEELFERKVINEKLRSAMFLLPEKQRKRVYAHYFIGMSKAAIARAEGVSRSTIKDSITRALRTLEVYLVKFS